MLGWNSAAKTSKGRIGSEEVKLKASTSLMARLLVITRSSREIDLKLIIGTYEFSTINKLLMTADGKLHPCSRTYLLTIDAMAVVNEQVIANLMNMFVHI